MGWNKRATVDSVVAAPRLGDPSFEVKYCAGVSWLVNLFPRVPRVVSRRHARYKREMTAVSVGTLAEDEATVPRGPELESRIASTR